MIKSISYNQGEIIDGIVKLHCPHGIHMDITYSKGNMYKKSMHSPKIKMDINPQTPDTIKGNANSIPYNNLSSIMFDPPFLATKGKSLSLNDDSNKIAKRFSVFPNEKSLWNFYKEVLDECYKKLTPNGILIFKCQDKVSSGKQYFSHVDIYNYAISIGFYAKDLFILLSKNRMTPDWQIKNQKNARKFHCYFWVFTKKEKSS